MNFQEKELYLNTKYSFYRYLEEVFGFYVPVIDAERVSMDVFDAFVLPTQPNRPRGSLGRFSAFIIDYLIYPLTRIPIIANMMAALLQDKYQRALAASVAGLTPREASLVFSRCIRQDWAEEVQGWHSKAYELHGSAMCLESLRSYCECHCC